MYQKANGSFFTIKNSIEENEFKEVLNKDYMLSKNFICVSVNKEQFTGKIKNVILQMKDLPTQVSVFNVDGTYPVLRLINNKISNSVFTIVFENNKQVDVEDNKHEKSKDLNDVTPITDVAPEESVKINFTPEENTTEDIIVSEVTFDESQNSETEDEVVVKKMTKRKKKTNLKN